MKGKPLLGVCAILATPFDEQGMIDFQSLKSLVDFELRAGVHGVAALGILGEVMRLSEEERRDVTKTVVETVAHRVPVVAGTGSTGTALAKVYSIEAEKLGVDAVMVSPPRLLKPNEDAIFKYYSDVAEAVGVPIVVQDEPLTYGVHLSPSFIARLAGIQGVGYVKLEDAPTPIKITQIRKLVGDKVGILGGLGGAFAYEELSRGARGLMTGFAYPEILVRIFSDFEAGRVDSARGLFYRALPLIRYEAQQGVSISIRKEILRRRGAIRTSTVREPAMKLDPETMRELDELLSKIDVKNLLAA